MMKDRHQIQAVIFDMDGVLFLSNDCHERAFQEALGDAKIKFSYPAIAGMRTDQAFRKVFEEAGLKLSDRQLENLVKQKQLLALKYLAADGEVPPDSRALITSLRRNFRLVLASSASQATVELFLRKSHYGDVFEACLDGSMVEKGKPSPEIYLLALERLGLDPENCVVVEDSVSGVRSGVAAGLKVIAIGRANESPVLLRSGASWVISELGEIEGLLQNITA